MRKKKWLPLIAAGIFAAALSGCGEAGTQAETGTEAVQETPLAETGGETGAEAGGEKTQIELWHYFSANNQAVLEEMIGEFNESQDRVEVIPTYIARADLMKQYTMGAISGELPDIGMVDCPDMASFITMGVFQDITDMVDAWGEADQFYDGPMDGCMQDGKIYGLPQNTNCLGLYYNLDLLKAAGLTEADIPATWDELYEAAKKCTTEDTYGFALCAKGTEEGTFSYIPWLYSAGADITTLDSEGSVRAMSYLSRMVEEGIMSKEVVNWVQTDVRDAFVAGKTVFMENGSWQIAALEELKEKGELGFEYGCAYLPMDQTNASVIGGENMGICSNDNREAAFEFFKYMMGKEGNAKFNLAAGKFPTRKDSMASEAIWTDDEKYKVFTEAMDFAVARGPHPEWPTISEGIYTAMQASLLGEKTPEQAMKDAAENANAILKQ